ncbi:MAG: hypothetical protein EOO75_02920 [Myxococcales bacterium]|nr:MAG: hypothetical protein EOO75_02920 [Myxococcales bacterium]
MHDDGPLTTDETRLDRIRSRARVLRGLLGLSAALGALPLVRGLAPSVIPRMTPIPGLSLLMGLALSMAWIWWLHESRRLLDALGLPSGLGSLTRGWAFFVLVPFVWMPLLLWAVHQLSGASDPSRLPPVVEEHVRTDGGFRDDPVERVTTGRVAHPVLALWIGAWVLSLGVFPLVFTRTSPTLILVLQSVSALLSALAAWQIVGAITHNLAELQRRASAR